MAKSFRSLLKKMPPWFNEGGEESDVIIGSMVRIVRNLAGHRFPGWSTEEGRQAVADELLPVIRQLPGNKTAAFAAEMTQLDYTQRRVLLERKLISQCMAARQQGCHIVINSKQDITFMVNEEEHLVMHLFSSSNDYTDLIRKGEDICKKIGSKVKFAVNNSGEYLTSLPAEVGTGIQLYTVMQLPALVAADMMQQITRGLEKLMLNIAPLYSNMGDDAANLFVIYTAPVLPKNKKEFCTHLRDITLTIAQREHEVRARLINNEATIAMVPDMVSRAYGLLRYATRLEYGEFINALCMIRLGIIARYIEPMGCTPEQLLKLLAGYYLLAAPHHMQYSFPNTTDAMQEIARTGISRDIINLTLLAVDMDAIGEEEFDDLLFDE